MSGGYRQLRRHRAEIRGFVQSGGRYLGFCLGGYLAGATPGFGVLPGDTDQYIAARAATVASEDNTLVDAGLVIDRLSIDLDLVDAVVRS
jgi:hypothetical protein